MKKLLISAILTFVFSATGFACTMPELHGLKPGMTKKEVQKLLDKKFLFLTKTLEYPDMPEVTATHTTKIEGTRSVFLRFYNDVVYSVTAVYDDSVKPKSLSEFAEASSKKLQLSDVEWNYMNSKYKPAPKESAKHAAIYCGNFQLFATGTPNYSLSVMNLDTFRYIDNLSRRKWENIKPYLVQLNY